jgi:hypothetical protein
MAGDEGPDAHDREALRARFSAMSIKALKEELRTRGVTVPGAVLEKSDLVDLLVEAGSGSGEGPLEVSERRVFLAEYCL